MIGASHRERGLSGVAVLVATVVLAGCGAQRAVSGTPEHPQARVTTTAPPPTTPPATTTTDPGTLPQTAVEPPFDAAFTAQMHTLWGAVASGPTSRALPLFFPEGAYLQMKTGVLADPSADYTDRLIAFYQLDLAAYRAALGNVAATLVGVEEDAADAAWIPPGACENRIGYWHLPGVRLVYHTAAGVASFAVASLISWRGVWYIVHLGPNPRPADVGTVDQPATGPGVPGPPGGC